MELENKNKATEKLPHVVQIDRRTGQVITVPDGDEYDPENETLDGATKTIGVVVPSGLRSNLHYLRNAREYALAPDNDIHEQIKMANIMYYREGLVGTAIDIFVDYASTIMEVTGIGDKEKDILTWWFENLNRDNNNMTTGMQGLINEMMLEYWIAGNVFTFRVDQRIPSIELGSKNIRGQKIDLPMEVYLIDPLFIDIPEVPTIVGSKRLFLRLEEEVLNLLRSNSTESQAILDGFPASIRSLIKRGVDSIPLPMDFVTHIKRKGRGYQTWGVPYLTKVFGDYARKKKLQALDEATIDGLINQITIFKIGDPKDESRQTWDPRRLRAFASLLASPNHTNYLVWTPDVEIESSGPNASILDFDKKYQQVDLSILRALGIPTILLSGEGAAADRAEGNAYVALSALMEKIEACRTQVKQYVENVMFEILKANKDRGMDLNIRDKPKLRWAKPNLVNEQEFREFVLAMYDRGLLPVQTTLEEGRYNFDRIKRIKIQEVEEGVDGHPMEEIFFRPDLPFSAPGEGAPGTPDGKGRPPAEEAPIKPPPSTTDTSPPASFLKEEK
jgi:hypothetical protein